MDNIMNFNQSVLESVVIFGVLGLVFGTILVLFWQYVVAGLALVFCVVVLANHKTPQVESKQEVQQVQQVVISKVVPDNTPIKPEQSLTPLEQIVPSNVLPVPKVYEVKPEVKPEVKEFDEHQAYLQDCMRLTGFEFETCEQMWTNRSGDEASQNVKYRKGKNHMVKVSHRNNS